MTPSYALSRLLEHGPLPFSEILEVTGWKEKKARKALDFLIDYGAVISVGKPNKRVYVLA